jgi:hypothetical protein
VEHGTNSITSDLVELEGEWIESRSDIDFYEPSLRRLTRSEEGLLFAMSRCHYPPLRNDDLVMHVARTRGYVNLSLTRLLDEGLIYRRGHGEYEYTLPDFDKFLRRHFTPR